MPKLNDTSNFKLQVENLALRKEIEKLTNQISVLQIELKKFKETPQIIIPSGSPLTTDTMISDEEIIALNQIKRLRDRIEAGQELTLEEVKKYDILVKNKRQVQSTEAPKEEHQLGLDDDNLLILANAKLEKK